MGADDSYTNDFFRDMYNSEIDHKYKLDSADNLLVGILLALSGVGIYYLKVLPCCNLGAAEYIFLVFCGLFVAAFACAVIFVIASFWPRDKEYIASPNEWGQYVDGLKAYYTYYHTEEESERRVARDLAKLLRQKYLEAGEVNRNLNIRIMAYQTWAKYSITAAVVLLLLNAIPTYFIQCAKTETQKTEVTAFPAIQKIQIVPPNPKDKSNEQGEQSNATTANRTAKTGSAKAGAAKERVGKKQRDQGKAN